MSSFWWWLFTRPVVSDSSWPHGLQHARPPCPSPSPGVCSNSWLNQWYHPTISSSVAPFSFCCLSFPASGSFSNESVLCIRWPKYWSFNFSVSPSNEFSGLISFKIDWFDHLAVQGILRSPLQHRNSFTIIREFAFISIKLSRRNILCSNLGQTMGWLSL